MTAQSGAAAKDTAAKTAGKLAEAEMEGGREAVREGGRETAREMAAKKGATAKGAGMKGIPAAGATKGFVAGGGKGAGLAAKAAGTTAAGAKTTAAGSALVPVKGLGLGLGLGLGVWGPVILGLVAAVAIFGYVSSRKVEKGQSDEEIELADALAGEG
ncbi:MAG: magnetic particle specific iron-binding protein [Rhodospirillales bacterium]|nr:magnetic particle specific iron-binding protein [Rhodospirillales bacterium]